MKKVLSVFLAIIITILSLYTDILYVAVQAVNTVSVWDGLEKAAGEGAFYQGDGTSENPYIISNGDQLYKMVYDFGTIEGVLNNGTPAYYKLGCDIYLNDVSDYAAWGKDGFDMSTLNNWAEYQDVFCHRTFFGNFNGDGHTIYGLYAYGYRVASFFPNVSHGAVVRNVNFKNSYTVNTSNLNANDQEDFGDTVGEKIWNAGTYGSAGVIFSRADAAGDGDYNTVDYTINNCSVTDAYVEAKYFTSAFVAAANSCQPYIANCMTANIILNSTSTTQGVEGAIINMPYGSTNPTATMENILAVGYPIYGVGRDEMWSGLKKPSMSHTYTFKNVYSTVSNTYTFNHSSYGSLSFTDSEVTVVDESKLIGAEAEETIPAFDWAYTWRAIEGGYPIPMREYIVPTGDEYYQNGGPKYSTDLWDGTVAAHFAAGDGSLEDPYLIANCEEFYLMVTTPNTDKYYEIAEGVTDLYFNDIGSKSYDSLMGYFSWGFGENYSYGGEVCFNGSFDGNGVVFHGISSTGDNNVGIFSRVGSATLKNFTVRYSYFKTNSSSTQNASVVIGETEENSVIYMKNIAIVDCNVNGNNAAGFVGNVNSHTNVYIRNCILSGGKITSRTNASQSAFVAGGTDCSVIVKNSISLGTSPISASETSYTVRYSGVYTDNSDASSSTEGVSVVESSELLAEQAKITCNEFDWENSWKVTDGIPMPRIQKFESGIVGEAWSGEIASAFAGGKGTESSPYLINTPEMLARMLIYGRSGEYYKLTADIYINDLIEDDWYKTAIKWFTSNDSLAFEGCLDGNGYTVHGLYAEAKSQNEYAALIPVLGTGAQVKRLKIDNAYLVGQKDSYLAAVAGILEDNAAVAANVNACVVGENVMFAGDANVGGIVASVGFSRLIVDNCVFKGVISTSGTAYGISGDAIGKLDVKECISKDVYPLEITENITANNVYTNVGNITNGIIVMDIDKMLGNNAKINMTAFDFNVLWKTVADNLPEPTGNVKAYDGIKGEVWSGSTAAAFAGGNGTEDSPYLIETGEQLALAISTKYNNSTAYFKLACDIYLNDVNSSLWENKVGCVNWIHSSKAGLFVGNFDGDGYVVFGMYYNYKTTPSNSYLGLFPRIGGSAQIKNIGVSQAYIKASTDDSTVYAGGLFGMGSAFYNFYGNKNTPTDTVGDVFLVPGDDEPTPLPSISTSFVDHTCYIEGYNASGIGAPGGAAIVIRDCIVTASIVPAMDSREGVLQGSSWAECSRVYNSLAFAQTDNKAIGGAHQWIKQGGQICTYTENVYYYGSKYTYGVTRLKRPQWRVGEEAKTAMPELDWENTWRVEPDGTPVLRIFDKENRGAELFSDKNFAIPDVKISFDTGVDSIIVDGIVGKPYETVNLPIPERQGYKFVAWHAFEDLTLEYQYDYFLPRDITLYAEWQDISVTQDFEDYPFTLWDCDTTIWNYNTAQSTINYNEDFVLSGKGSMQLMSGSTDVAALLMNYEKTLTAGQTYTISLWVANEEDTQPQLALAHKMYPDYMAADKLIEPLTSQGNSVNGWTQYTHTFVAQTPWVALKVLYSGSLYVDDIVITSNGDLLTDAVITSNIDEGEFYANILENITLSSGVTTVGDFAFAYSDFITDVIISDSVKQIGEYAFYDCDRLTDVWYAGSQEDFESITISANNESLKNAVWHFDSCAMGIEHSYDNNCDSICNNCKYVRAVSEHIYDGAIDTDCNVCGYVRDAALIGDVNGDNTINNKDLGLLMQYLNDWDVEIVAENSDVNVDSSINNKDYGILMQYLNGWDVNLGYPN